MSVNDFSHVDLLGPLAVRVGSRTVPIPRAKHRALLAVLALDAGACVAKERLIDELWGEAPPESASHALQVHVSGLRKLLGAPLIATCPGGYKLDLPPDAVDALRVASLVAAARSEPDTAVARATVGEALALFRGRPLADVELEAAGGREVARLEDLHAEARELQLDLDLAAGGGAALIAPAERLVAEYPLREHPRAQLMLALYRAGRQADALAAFQEARRTFVEHLGIEPSPALRQVEHAILQQDESELVPPRVAATAAPALAEERPRGRRQRLVGALAFAALAAAAGAAASFLLPTEHPRAASDTSPPAASPLTASTLVLAPTHVIRHAPGRPRAARPRSSGRGTAAPRVHHTVVPRVARTTTTVAAAPPPQAAVTTRAAVTPPPITIATRPTSTPRVVTHPVRTTPVTTTTSADPVHYVDTFDGGVVDSSFWNVMFNGSGADAVQSSGKLVLSITAGASPGGEFNNVGAQYGSRSCFAGDIDMQVEYRLVSWPPSSGAYVSLNAVFADGMVERFASPYGSGDVIGSWIKPRFKTTSATAMSGALRVTRTAGVLTTYYLDGGAWQAIDSATAPSPAHLHIGLSMNPGLSPPTNVVVELDDFSMTAGRPTASC